MVLGPATLLALAPGPATLLALAPRPATLELEGLFASSI